jgi:hypothetical protein
MIPRSIVAGKVVVYKAPRLSQISMAKGRNDPPY